MSETNDKLPVELREVMKSAEALARLPADGPEWQALELWFGKSVDEAVDMATAHETDEAKRQGWAGSACALRELREQLRDLRSGRWKQWPAVKAWEKQTEEI